MKLKFAASFLLIASIAVISCKKSDDNTPQNTAVNDSLITKIRQGIVTGEDTTYVIGYNANNKVDTIWGTMGDWASTLTVTYDESGNVSLLSESYDGSDPDNTRYSFNTNNQLTEIYNAGSKDRHTFEYTNGVLSKKSRYVQTNASSPALNLWQYFTYEFTDGNITRIREYNSVNALVEETTYTYTSEPNIFRSIALFNFSNTLGTYDIASEDLYFNKNLPATSTAGTNTRTYTYTHNDKKQLTKVVTSDSYETLTRELSY